MVRSECVPFVDGMVCLKFRLGSMRHRPTLSPGLVKLELYFYLIDECVSQGFKWSDRCQLTVK